MSGESRAVKSATDPLALQVLGARRLLELASMGGRQRLVVCPTNGVQVGGGSGSLGDGREGRGVVYRVSFLGSLSDELVLACLAVLAFDLSILLFVVCLCLSLNCQPAGHVALLPDYPSINTTSPSICESSAKRRQVSEQTDPESRYGSLQ